MLPDNRERKRHLPPIAEMSIRIYLSTYDLPKCRHRDCALSFHRSKWQPNRLSLFPRYWQNDILGMMSVCRETHLLRPATHAKAMSPRNHTCQNQSLSPHCWVNERSQRYWLESPRANKVCLFPSSIYSRCCHKWIGKMRQYHPFRLRRNLVSK